VADEGPAIIENHKTAVFAPEETRIRKQLFFCSAIPKRREKLPALHWQKYKRNSTYPLAYRPKNSVFVIISAVWIYVLSKK
jgi:hypothetical protein